MRMTVALAAFFAACTGAAAQTDAEAPSPSTGDLEFLVGDWSGNSTLYLPLDDDRGPVSENSTANCAYMLEGAFIRCDTSWTSETGRRRIFRVHFNYNEVDGGYQVTFLYANWPRSLSYLLEFDADANAYIGYIQDETDDGVQITERIEWRFSEDGRQVRCDEYVRLETDAEDQWRKSFEFVWRKTD